MRRRLILGVLGLCGWPAAATAAPGAGTLDDPIRVDAFPYYVAGDTAASTSSVISTYACDPGLDESGPEVVYRFTLPESARVTAWIEGDTDVVDVDVHLLHDLTLDGTSATNCAYRANQIAEAAMEAGEHFVVIDSYAGAAQAGPYVLRMHAIGDSWYEVPIGNGVTWRARRYADLSGPQVMHVVNFDPAVPGVDLEMVDPDGCQTVAALAAQASPQPVAAVNSSFFSFDGCPSLSLMKQDGEVLSFNAARRGVFGLSMDGAPMVEIIDANADWPDAHDAQGGVPMLATGGVAFQGDEDWADQGLTNAGFNGPNPRTFIGYREDGTLFVGTADGRRPNALGLPLDTEATWVVDELGAHGAVNLDGGGSTSMWVGVASPSGVANYPSDAGMVENADHSGSRAVGGAVFVHADPYEFPPRFQTEPVTSVDAGQTYLYDADAIDLDVDDTVTFELADGPDGMTVDPATGELTYEATVDSPPQADVELVALDDDGTQTLQAFALTIVGGMGTPGDTDGGDTGEPPDPDPTGDAGSDSASSTESGQPTTTGCEQATQGCDETDTEAARADSGSGCGCTSNPSRSGWVLLVVFGVLRGSRRPSRSRLLSR